MRLLLPEVVDDLDPRALEELYAYPDGRNGQGNGRWLRANFVAAADGAVRGPDGRSGSISGGADRQVFALLRSLADLILVGAGTTRAEGYQPVRPRETRTEIRRRHGLSPLPPIAVVSRRLDLLPRLLVGDDESEDRAPTIVLTCHSAPKDRLAELEAEHDVVVAGDDEVDLVSALEQLAKRGLRRVLCEGGPHLMGHLLRSRLVDELCLTTTPLLLAGDAPRLTDGPPLDPPTPLRLSHLLEDDGMLLASYHTVRPATT